MLAWLAGVESTYPGLANAGFSNKSSNKSSNRILQ